MYTEDSFFTLNLTGQVGLVCFSMILGGVTIAVLWHIAKSHDLLVRLSMALVLYYLFVWLSPQLYYTFYIFLFGNLPWQVVIGFPPLPADIAGLLWFQDRANLSYHSRGILGWLMIFIAMMRPRLA